MMFEDEVSRDTKDTYNRINANYRLNALSPLHTAPSD
jgi:hypothetical protein